MPGYRRAAAVEGLEARALLADVPAGFVDAEFAMGLTDATSMAFAPDGRLFVTEQAGAVRVIKHRRLLATPFATVATEANGERGLLGVTFDPDFEVNGHLYVYHTVPAEPRFNRVTRFTAANDAAVDGSATTILELDPLTSATNHNGGAIHFGPDGKLYVAVGENATRENAQTLANRHGKILRINKDGSIPTDNPFFDEAAGANRAIWALGLRNPFTFAFRPGSSRMFINDVGGAGFEEVNDGAAGRNFGWPQTEGSFDAIAFPDFTNPVFAYPRGTGPEVGRAITGGAFYEPARPQFPDTFEGDYFFADLASGWIRTLDAGTNAPAAFADGIDQPVDLDVGPDGSLFYLERGTGAVGRIRFVGEEPATAIVRHPANQSVTRGGTATFTAGAVGEGPLSFQWQRNSVDIPGATSVTLALANLDLGDDGARIRAVITGPGGTATTNSAALSVAPNQPPRARIVRPSTGLGFLPEQTITFAGLAFDPEDGGLGGGAFTWRVDVHDAGGVRNLLPDTTGERGGSFAAPTARQLGDDGFLRITLVVRDDDGLEHRRVRDVRRA